MKKKLECINTKKKPSRSIQNKLIIYQMETNIKKNTGKIWLPNYPGNFTNTETDSWFDHESFNCKTSNKFVEKFKKARNCKQIKKCIKVKLILNKTQQLIINNWLNACRSI